MTTTHTSQEWKNKAKEKAKVSWAYFDKENNQHRLILSLCRQAQWVKPHSRFGEVVDLERLQVFLKSVKSPVNKPLKSMTRQELSKIIIALEGIVNHKYK